MAKEKILSEDPLTMGELKDILTGIQERDGELGFRAARTLDYLNHTVTSKKTKDLLKQLRDLNIPRFKDVHIAKVVDIMPGSLEELKLVLSGYIVTVNQENLKKILTVLEDFRK